MILNEFEKYARSRADWKVCEENFEGIRVNAFDGWFLLRISVHDPVMPINMESNSVGGIAKMKNALTPFFKSFSDLDISSFNQCKTPRFGAFFYSQSLLKLGGKKSSVGNWILLNTSQG